jgi:hypothetical protein
MLYDWNFAGRIKCSEKEKMECMKLITTFMSLADKARREGILALEDDVNEFPSFFMRKGLQLAIDGTAPEMIREILELYILTGNHKGKELLERCIIMEGVLAIQSAYNPDVIQLKLSPFFGENFTEEYNKQIRHKNMREYIDQIKDKTVNSEKTSNLENLIKFDDRAIQRVLCEIDPTDLVVALKGASGNVIMKIFNNMSERSLMIATEDMKGAYEYPDEDISEAQKRMLNIIDKLRETGEIFAEDS